MTTTKLLTWFTYPKLRAIAFYAHRWLGLTAGILLCIAGVTGSILVFWHEIDHAVIAWRFGQVSPVGEPLSVTAIVETVKAAYANKGLTLSSLTFPDKPEAPFLVAKRKAQEVGRYGNTRIYLDQFTGELVQLQDGVKPSRAEAVLNQFNSVHFGTFGGLPTRIFYVFVGLTPLILFITERRLGSPNIMVGEELSSSRLSH